MHTYIHTYIHTHTHTHSLIISKIPKEQNTTVDLSEGTLELKMRVFVSNSEDAKAVSDYIQSHSTQVLFMYVRMHVCTRNFHTYFCRSSGFLRFV